MWCLSRLVRPHRARLLRSTTAAAEGGIARANAAAATAGRLLPLCALHIICTPTRVPLCITSSSSARNFATAAELADSIASISPAGVANAASKSTAVPAPPPKRTRRSRAKSEAPEPRHKQPKTLSSVPLVTADIDELLSMKVSEQAPILKPRANFVHPPPLARPHALYARLPTWTDRYGDPFAILVGTDGSVYQESARTPTWIIGAERQDGTRVLLFKRPLMKDVAGVAQMTTPPLSADDTSTQKSSKRRSLPPVTPHPVPADIHPQWLISPLHFSLPTAEAVLLAHGHPRPSKWHVVARRNGRRDDNQLENLYWQPPKERAAIDLQRLRDEALAAGVKDLEIHKNTMGNAFIATTGEFYSLLSLNFHDGRFLPHGYRVRMRSKAVYECFATLVPQTAEEKEGLTHVRAKFPLEPERAEEGADAAAPSTPATPAESGAPVELPAGSGKMVDVYRIKDGYDLEHLDGDFLNCARANLRLISSGVFFKQTEDMQARLQAHMERMQQEIRRVKGEIPIVRETLLPSEPHAQLPRPCRTVEDIPPEKVDRLIQALHHPTHPIGLGKHYFSARLRLANELKLVEVDIRRWLIHVKDNPHVLPTPPTAAVPSASSSPAAASSSSADSSSSPSLAPPSPSAGERSSPTLVTERLHGHQLGRPLALPPTQALLERLSDPTLPWTYLGRKHAVPFDLLKYHAKALTREARRRGGGAEMAKVILLERTEQIRQEALAGATNGDRAAAAAAAELAHPPEVVEPPELRQALERHRERRRAMEALLLAMYEHPESRISDLQDQHDPDSVLNTQYVKRNCKSVLLMRDRGRPAVERYIKDIVGRMIIIFDEKKWIKPRRIKKRTSAKKEALEATEDEPAEGTRKRNDETNPATQTTATKRTRKPKAANTMAAPTS